MSMQVSDSQISRTRHLDWALRLALCLITASVSFSVIPGLQTSTQAQDDSFALGSDPGIANDAPKLTNMDDLSQKPGDPTRLILRSIRESNPLTPEQLAKAANVMIDVELYGDARYYISLIAQLGLNDDQLFELQETIGSDFFSMIQINDAVQPEGKTLARQVLSAATRVAT